MIERTDNHLTVTQTASGGAVAIVGLVISAIVFLALLLVFGEALFSGSRLADSEFELPKVETSAK
jgi:hypothetical protein